MAIDPGPSSVAAWKPRPRRTVAPAIRRPPGRATQGASASSSARLLLMGVLALGAMFINNSRYDGNSPVPVSEQRR